MLPPSLVPGREQKSLSSICSQDMRACFTPTSVVNRLSARWF